MDDNVVNLFGDGQAPVIPTEDRIDPAKVLEAAQKKDLDQVIIVGLNQDGSLFLAASEGDLAVIHYLLSISSYEVLKMGAPSN